MIGISVSTLQLPAIRATSKAFLLLKLTVNFHFAFFAGLALPRVKKGVLNDAGMVETAVHPHKAVIVYTLL